MESALKTGAQNLDWLDVLSVKNPLTHEARVADGESEPSLMTPVDVVNSTYVVLFHLEEERMTNLRPFSF